MLKTLSKYIAEYYNWLDSYANILVIEYDKFMELVALSGKQLIGPEDIEKCWQAHILNTELYHQYCMGRFGRIIHYKILNLSSQERVEQIDKTYKLYLSKCTSNTPPNKLVWVKNPFSKPLNHWVSHQIEINIWSKTGKKYAQLVHQFNSAESFGYIKELIGYKFNIPSHPTKIYVNKLNLSELVLENLKSFYKLDSKLEIPDSLNVSGVYSFGIGSFDLVIQSGL